MNKFKNDSKCYYKTLLGSAFHSYFTCSKVIICLSCRGARWSVSLEVPMEATVFKQPRSIDSVPCPFFLKFQ